MSPTESVEVSTLSFNRLDNVKMNSADREDARAMMRQAEAFAGMIASIQQRACDTGARMMNVAASLHARCRSALSHAGHR